MGVGFFLRKWVRGDRYCQNKGRSVSFLSKMGGSGLLSLKNGWEWVRVDGSGWEWVRLTGSC